MNQEHLLVTAPDRYWADGIKILLVDWPAELLETTVNMIQGSPEQIILHSFNSYNDDPQWLLDVANQVDFAIINMGTGYAADVFKGTLLLRKNVFHYGRESLNKFYSNHTTDPQGKLLVLLGETIKKMENQNV